MWATHRSRYIYFSWLSTYICDTFERDGLLSSSDTFRGNGFLHLDDTFKRGGLLIYSDALLLRWVANCYRHISNQGVTVKA